MKTQGDHVGTMTVKQCDLVPGLYMTLESFFTLQVQAALREVESCELLLFSPDCMMVSFGNVTNQF